MIHKSSCQRLTRKIIEKNIMEFESIKKPNGGNFIKQLIEYYEVGVISYCPVSKQDLCIAKLSSTLDQEQLSTVHISD